MTAVARQPRCAWCGGETYTASIHPLVVLCDGCGKTPAEGYLAAFSPDGRRMAETENTGSGRKPDQQVPGSNPPRGHIMTDIESLVARLGVVESSLHNMPDGVTTNWYRNPDGPEAIAAIRTLQTEKVELRDCLQQFVNGVETHMIDSPADDILANVTNRARQALSNTGEME